jgi:DNA-binding YbaB/EbfC family protein
MKKIIRKKGPQSGGKLPNNPNAMLSQVQKMQEDMAVAQETLANEFTTVTVGGGAITVEISGQQRVKAIAINPELLDPEELEMLQDLLVSAVNQAIEQSQAMAAQRMEAISSGVSGLNDMLGGLGISL